jgi:hypothetical protein
VTNGMGLTPTDFGGLPGAPFTQDEIDAAVAAVQGAARWHISPEQQDTIALDVQSWERVLRLPTRHLVSVDEIRDTYTSTVIDPGLYRVSVEFPKILRRCGVWPCGYGRIEVDITHGYDEVPKDLLPVIAESALLDRRDQTVSSETQGPFSIGYSDSGSRTANPLSTGSVLERYSYGQPGMA